MKKNLAVVFLALVATLCLAFGLSACAPAPDSTSDNNNNDNNNSSQTPPDDEPQTADELAQKSGLSISELLAELTILEIHGQVQSAPGNRFMRTK